MRSIFVVGLTLAMAPVTVLAQDEEAEVMAVVNQLFDAMRARDGAAALAAFHTGAFIVSLGGDSVGTSAATGFATAVGGSQDEQWNEPIWDTTVQIDGNLALVWTRYAFFRGPNGDQFSHCGFNAFMLHKGSNGWGISALSDTRQRDNCEMPPGN